ncbi:MAG TPA: Xaa-Pro peptidase family protein [candidate division Zixibacteria bacterium]|nr:Xaa-Pro peptidase family protein [candidate division Zixibacteria bacterium]
MDLVKAKINQVYGILNELNLDSWLVFVRETSMMADPVVPLVVGHEVTWQSFFLYSKTGKSYALVGNFDKDNFERSGRFDEVLTYTASPIEEFRRLVDRVNPGEIALDYSTSDSAADGLTHGMFLLLKEYLQGTPYADKIITAEEFISKLRSRKTPEEIKLLKKAAIIAGEVWDEVSKKIKVGMTEKEIGGLIDKAIAKKGCKNSFDTLVNAGDKTEAGHGTPTNAKLGAGDLLHVDFGVLYQNYCSDIQRLIYFKRPKEKSAPAELLDAFDMVNDIISQTASLCKPGKKGHEIDSLARQILVDNGYPEYQHALGHQLGRSVHDGGAVLGPKWERYGNTPEIPLEEGNVFTLELEILLPGIGCVGMEEDVSIINGKTVFLSKRQLKLLVK